MARRQALIVEANGERFRFYYDPVHREVLHITLQHGTMPEDAIRALFEGETEEWDEVRLRFATYSDRYGLFWTRHAFDQSIIIISCFKLGDE